MDENRGPSPPPARAVNLANMTVQQLDELLQLNLDTDRMYADSTLLFAIEQNKSQQMICEHRNLLAELGLERDQDTQALEPTQFRGILQDVYPEELGKYQHKVLGWNRKNFKRTNMVVTYGNCPQCFRAYPKGHECFDCNERSKTLYFVLQQQVFPPYFDHSNGPVGIAEGTHCEPLEVASLMELQDKTPIVLDYNRLVSTKDGYEPNNKGLYEFITLDYLLGVMGVHAQHKGDRLDDFVQGSTKAPIEMVRAAVDERFLQRRLSAIQYGSILVRREGPYSPQQQNAIQAYSDWANQANPYEPF